MSKLTTSAMTVAFFALHAFASTASAACIEGGDATNPTLTCTATDSGNIDDNRDNLSVNVDSDAQIVRASGRPVQLEGSDQSITNQGLIESGDDDAIRGKGVNLTVDNYGTIRGGDRGIRLQDDADGFTLINRESGRIFAVNQAVRLDNGDELVNATITNYGLIESLDGRAIQSRGPGSKVFNYGTLRGGEEVIEAREDFYLENHGTIAIHGLEWDAVTRTWTKDDAIATADQDGVQFASGEVHNYGLIMSTDDGIDFDEGLVHNYATGAIISAGPNNDPSKGGIDVDPLFEPTVGAARVAGPLTIINEGYIEGGRAIATDDASTAQITIENSGTLLGRSGTAIGLAPGQGNSRLTQRIGGVILGNVLFGSGNDVLEMRGGQINGDISMGAGDDVLEYYAGRISGLVDMGTGTNTLRVFATQVGTLTFAAAPEVVDMSNAPDYALFAGLTLAVAEPRAFAAMDEVAARLNYGLAGAVLRPALGSGWWVSGNGRVAEDDRSNGILAGGRDFGNIGLYVVHSRGQDDALHKVDQQGTAIGLRSGWTASDNMRISGTLFAGIGEASIDSPTWATGSGEADGHFVGLSARIDHARPASADAMGSLLSAQLGVTRYSHDAFTVSGLGGAKFASRDVTTAFLSAEAALPVKLNNGMELRPFIGAHTLFTDADQVTMSLPGGSTTFATDGDKSVSGLNFGTELHLPRNVAPWRLRLEAQLEDDGTKALALGAFIAF